MSDSLKDTLVPGPFERIARPEYTLNGRPIVDIEIEYRGVDSFISGAAWDDTGLPLTDDELTDLQDDATDYISERTIEHYGYGPK